MKIISKFLSLLLFFGAFALFETAPALTYAGAPSASISQARNGTDSLPVSPMNWVNGNLGTGTAHYIEGMSAPYRCVMINLTPGVRILLTIGYDITNSGKHAIDYLTHYNRVQPHNFFWHGTAETIDPLAGSGLAAGTPFSTYPVPYPSSVGSPVPGQPSFSYTLIPAAERVFTIYNGTMDTAYYLVQGDLNASNSETRMVLGFTPTAATTVIAWGGHIGSRNDWGYTAGIPNSAGGISGSPFHMRLVDWNLNNLGNQDRSLSGATVGAPDYTTLPVCMLSFAAEPEGSANRVHWTTASEVNSDHYTIERSSSALTFEPVARIHGAGTTSLLTNYEWKDEQPLAGTSYYRLVQTDYDGASHIYGPVSVQSGGSNEPSKMKVFAEQGSGRYFVSFRSPRDGNAHLEILDLEGKKISSETFQVEPGQNFARVNDVPEHPGIYFLRLWQDDVYSGIQKIIVN
jgi:hypothetical protein